MLVEQYRMHQQIMQWSSDAMYAGKLVANEGNSKHSVQDLVVLDPEQGETEFTEIMNGNPLLLIDTAGAMMYEDIDEGIYSTVYTDGDGGLMLFEGYCEMFEEQGVSMRLIDCTYCDIPYSLITEIMRELEEATNYRLHLFSEDFE